MRVLPKTLSDQLLFLQTHLPLWAADPGAVGLTAADIAGLTALYDKAKVDDADADEARAAAKRATVRLRDSARAMATAASRAIARIKVAAQADSTIYGLAGVRPPAPMSTTPPPGLPRALRVELQQPGALSLAWSCDNPRGTQGTLYNIERRTYNHTFQPGPFVQIAIVGEKLYTDETIPAGVTSIEYQITALRCTTRGPAARFQVQVGTSQFALKAAA